MEKFGRTIIDLKTNSNNKMIKKSFSALIFLYSWAFRIQFVWKGMGRREPACVLEELLLKRL
jgi:hypothetical protein